MKPATALFCIFALVGSYYFAALIQTVFHRWFGHHRRITRIYEIHAKGHHAKYPPHRLSAKQWIDSEQHVMWFYAIPFLPAATLIGWLFGPWILCSHIMAVFFAIWWHIYLHKEYHLSFSRWERFKWFKKKRELHFIHHRDVRANYAIVEYWLDTLLGTRKEPVLTVGPPRINHAPTPITSYQSLITSHPSPVRNRPKLHPSPAKSHPSPR
jgi:hypothetical protein